MIINVNKSELNFDNYKNEDNLKFVFSDLPYEEIKENFLKIVSFESTNKKRVLIDLKQLKNESLIEVFRDSMKLNDLSNLSVILNLSMILTGYNTLDEKIFESDEIYFKGFKDLIDIRQSLKKEILEFQTELSKWFLSCIKSLFKVEYTYMDNVVEIPNIYRICLSTFNMMKLSQILAKSSNIETKDLYLVKDAYPIVSQMASSLVISNNLLSKMF